MTEVRFWRFLDFCLSKGPMMLNIECLNPIDTYSSHVAEYELCKSVLKIKTLPGHVGLLVRIDSQYPLLAAKGD